MIKEPHFKKGQTVDFCDSTNTRVQVLDYLGGGKQGDVYKVRNLTTGEILAMKHLYGSYAKDKLRFRRQLSGKEAFYAKCVALSKEPAPHSALAWPIAVSAMTKTGKSFLYTMPLLEGYQEISQVIKDDSLTLEERARIVMALTEPMYALHSQNLVYGDISHTNFLVKRLADGSFRVAVIDCENINLSQYNMGLRGTGDYRAPELIIPDPNNGGQPHVPTVQSDIHAFAVLTYRIFCRHHPLDGNLVLSQDYTKENFARFYGTDPKFSMGENNNEPFIYALERWKRLPEILRLYYLQVFSPDCLHGKTPRMDLAAFRKVMRLSFRKNT